VIATLQGPWTQGTIGKLKYLSYGIHGSICLYFDNCFTLSEGTKDPHYLFKCIQFSRIPAGIREITFSIDGVATSLMKNCSYCSGVKVCAGEECTYSVSTKQTINHCIDHKSMPSGPCPCYTTYVYQKNALEDGSLLC